MHKDVLVLGVLRDGHHLGSMIVRAALERAGFKVIHAGLRLEQEEFINAAIEADAAAILISTQCGDAEFECRGLREKCDEAGLKGIRLYVGGLLTQHGSEETWEETSKKFVDMGYDRAYSPDVKMEQVALDLKHDLGIKA